ncbi:putative capsid protein [Odonata-associated circular virus-18]|uniref:putative capsid protein n=1 Tax=Odonata-associated circular virus-18 TaxID=1592118 RepID=UPI000585F11A|nr:putative capsid protein [Odonata-associated circular virus-18]AJD07496.1 putative capsid protein [Odonata-associated circular virus-18]
MAKRYKKKSYRKSSRKRPRNSVSKKAKRCLNRAIRRSIETKRVHISPTIAVYSNTITDANVFSYLPSSSSGIDNTIRTRNVVRLRNRIFHVSGSAFAKNIYANWFDIYIFKEHQEGGPPNAAEMNFFSDTATTAVAYAGISLDGLRPINSDMFTICYHKRIVLTSVQSNVASKSVFGSVKPSFNLTKHITSFFKKTWVYDDSALVTPNNDNLLLAIGATQTDGVSLGASQIGKYECLGWLAYEDA